MQSTQVSTPTTIPAVLTTPATIPAVLTECGIFAYQLGLKEPWTKFYDAALTKLANPIVVSGTSANTRITRARGRPRRARVTAVSMKSAMAKTGSGVSKTAAKAGSGVSTNNIFATISANPGISDAQLRKAYPKLAVNVLGRMLAGATKATKTRGAMITLMNGGYYPINPQQVAA